MLPSAHHPLLFRFLLFCFGKWLFLYTMSFYKLVILCVAVMFSCVTVPVCTMNNLLCMFLFCLYLNIVDRRNKTSMRWIWVELTWAWRIAFRCFNYTRIVQVLFTVLFTSIQLSHVVNIDCKWFMVYIELHAKTHL